MCPGLDQKNEERERLIKIKAFYLRLSVTKTPSKPSLPDSLTLHINRSAVRPDSPAFVTLHRVVSASEAKPVFGSRERVAAGEGARFDVYFGEDKLLRGVFRRDGCEESWKVECKCALEMVEEVWVEAEGQAPMREKVAKAVAARRRRRRGKVGWFHGLEEIPEEREEEEDEVEREGGTDGGDCGEGGGKDIGEVMEVEMEGVRLAVDVGIWVVCLGVGYLVSSLTRIKLS